MPLNPFIYDFRYTKTDAPNFDQRLLSNACAPKATHPIGSVFAHSNAIYAPRRVRQGNGNIRGWLFAGLCWMALVYVIVEVM